jgi:hypothetical protein
MLICSALTQLVCWQGGSGPERNSSAESPEVTLDALSTPLHEVAENLIATLEFRFIPHEETVYDQDHNCFWTQ